MVFDSMLCLLRTRQRRSLLPFEIALLHMLRPQLPCSSSTRAAAVSRWLQSSGSETSSSNSTEIEIEISQNEISNIAIHSNSKSQEDEIQSHEDEIARQWRQEHIQICKSSCNMPELLHYARALARALAICKSSCKYARVAMRALF